MNNVFRNVLLAAVALLLFIGVVISHHLNSLPSSGLESGNAAEYFVATTDQRPDSLLATSTQEPVPIAACVHDRFSSSTILDSKVEGGTRTRLVRLPDFPYPNIVVEDTLVSGNVSGEARLIEQKAMVADHILVALNKGSSLQALEELCHQAGATVRRRLHSGERILYVVGLAQPSLDAVKSAVVNISKRSDVVAYAEPDGLFFPTGIPNDPNFAAQYYLHNTGQNGGIADADIDAPEAWDITTGSRNVLVGIVDSGIDINHPDLAANIWTNPGEIPNNGIDDDNNGYTDDVHGWNFMNNNNDVLDIWLHGTHVAGIVGAEGGNGKYVAGVCHKVSMVSIKAIDFAVYGGAGVTSAAVEGVYYATSVGVSVTNNSYGGQAYSTAMRDAIADAGAHGVLFVASAGNESRDTDQGLRYPSCYDLPNIICVGATDKNDARAFFTYPWGSPPFPSSNVGAATVDLFAPGDIIYSIFPTYKTSDMQSKGLPTNYHWLSGTSMSAPMVAGVCALLKAKYPGLSASQIKSAILESVDVKASLHGLCLTNGRLNAYSALQRAATMVAVASPVISTVEADSFATATSNGDGIVHFGEIVPLTVTLRNDGSRPFGTLQGALSLASASPGITLNSADATFLSMETSLSTAASFRIEVTNKYETVPMRLTLTDGTGQTWILDFLWKPTYHPTEQVLAWGSSIPEDFATFGADTGAKPSVAAVTALPSTPVGVDLHGGVTDSIALLPDGYVWLWGTAKSTINGKATQVQGLGKVTSIAKSFDHFLVLLDNGGLQAWGNNSSGQLGNGTQTDSSTPVQVLGLNDIRDIGLGDHYSMAVRGDGTLWSWGNNSLGELGDGVGPSLNDRLVPGIVPGLARVTKVSVSSTSRWPFVLALTADGKVWSWGYNNVGQLGYGNASSRTYAPAQVSGLSDIVAISAGSEHSFALDSRGVVFGWGNNDYGQLGLGTTAIQTSPVIISMNRPVIKMAAGGFHSLLLTDDGHVWGMGANTFDLVNRVHRLLDHYNNSDKILSPVDLSQRLGITRKANAIYAQDSRNIVVIEKNLQPVAGDQNLTIRQGNTLSIQLAATDADNDPLSFAVKTAPAHGTLSGTAPNLTYTPASGFVGVDRFTFQANDGSLNSNLGTISITVQPNNVTPNVTWTSASQTSANESGTLTVTARLSATSTKAVSVPFTVTGTSSAADRSISASPITIAAGATTGSATITITSDTLDEPNETVILTMGTPMNATLGATKVHTATITDDDIANRAPTLLSAASALPNPATTNDTVAFTSSASDPDSDPLVYSWDFGDGATAVGATASHRYSVPGVYSAKVTVRDGRGGSVAGGVTVTVVTPSIPVNLRVNFQLAGSPVPSGYLSDTGAVFGDRGNGQSYGWNADNTATARDRNAANSPDQRYDTLLHLQKATNPNAVWEIAVPNGTYSVRVVAGDSSHFDSIYKLNVEGVLAVSSKPTATARWFEGTKTVTVSDGRLTVGSAAGAANNKICFIEIDNGVAARELAAEAPEALPLNVTKLQLAMNFSKPGRDAYRVFGTLPALSAEFSPANQAVSVDVGAAIAEFTLDAKGRGKNKNGTFTLKRDKKSGWVFAAAIKKGAWTEAWSDGGLLDTTTTQEAEIPVTLTLTGQTFGGSKMLTYKAKEKTSATAK